METTIGNVTLESVETLQKELRALAENLDSLHGLLSRAVSDLNEDWLDDKFYEFDDAFRPRRDEVSRIADSYAAWADGHLQNVIDRIRDAGKTGMGI